MRAVSRELIEIVERLSEDRARTIVDFARFLQQQAGDAEWERLIDEQRSHPKLDAGG